MMRLKVVLEFESEPSPELTEAAVSLVQQAIAQITGVRLVGITEVKAVAA